MIARFERDVHIDCDVSSAFQAWSDADTFARWFAPMADSPPEVEIDFRVGGRYRVRMELGPDQVHVTEGEYREIVPDRRIVFSWRCDAFADRPTVVVVTFEAVTGGTRVSVLHEDFQSAEAGEGQTMGWTACMTSLKTLLEDSTSGNSR